MGESLPQALEPLALPLFGERLIEASAGTGKTYTLAALYLRLLLGLGGAAAYPRPLEVEEILVVTFTEAATEELRNRIRDNIHRLRMACLRRESKEPMLSSLLAQIEDFDAAASWLLAAEHQMDEAAIYTIHGFCQRTLSQNAFESGVPFEQTLIEDELPLRRQYRCGLLASPLLSAAVTCCICHCGRVARARQPAGGHVPLPAWRSAESAPDAYARRYLAAPPADC